VGRRLFGALLTAASLLAGCGDAHTPRELVVGAGADPESTVLAELYAAALRYYGSRARVAHMTDPIAELDRGEVNVVGGFTGDVLQMFAPGTDNVISDQNVYRAMVAALPEGVAAGDYAKAAEDKPTVAVTSQTAQAWGDRQLATLIAHCGRLTMGSVAGTRHPVEVGGCNLPGAHEFNSDAALFAALRAGQIDAAWTSTADPGIPDDVVVLSDRRPSMVQAENVVPLYRRDLSEAEVRAINEVAGEFETSTLADMRGQVARGADPRQVAEGWLAAHPLGR
jgi:glycine betaine/choline ABC-type transport system substrate-binding protein